MREEEIEQELGNNKADMVFPTNEGYVKVENIEKVRDVIISKSVRVSKIIEESELKGKTFKAEITIKDTVMLILLLTEEEKKPEFFSPVISSPKQRIKFRDWEAIGVSSAGRIYKQVVNRILEEYKDGIEPKQGIISNVIREMYGEHLTKSSLSSYASVYKRYIRENKLAVEPSAKEQKTNNLHIGEPIVNPSQITQSRKKHEPKTKELLPMEKVVEIWELLPDEFEYKQVKALVPAHIFQSSSRIDTVNYIIKQFLDNPAFECEETLPGVFKKKIE